MKTRRINTVHWLSNNGNTDCANGLTVHSRQESHAMSLENHPGGAGGQSGQEEWPICNWSDEYLGVHYTRLSTSINASFLKIKVTEKIIMCKASKVPGRIGKNLNSQHSQEVRQ